MSRSDSRNRRGRGGGRSCSRSNGRRRGRSCRHQRGPSRSRSRSRGRGGNDASEALQFPREVMGRVIGKQGATIKDIRAQSQAIIKVQDTENDMCEFTLSGRADAVERAKSMILDIANRSGKGSRSIDDTYGRGGDSGGKGYGSRAEDQTMEIPSTLVGRIIGKGGETIRQLQNDSGAKVDIRKDEPGIVRLGGSAECIARAKEMITDIIERDRTQGPNNDAYGSRRPEKCEDVMEVPNAMMGRIIGRGGETIQKLQSDSGAKVDISKDQPGTIRLSGSRDAISQARDMIMSLVEYGPQDKGKGKGKSEDTMQVPPSMAGKIVGKGGETIMQIQQESGCKVDLKKEDLSGAVRLCGSSDSIEKAKRFIKAVLNGFSRGEGGQPLETMDIAPQIGERLMDDSIQDLKMIEDESGARIDVDTALVPCKVSIVGTIKAIVKAQSLLYDLVERLDISDTGCPRGNSQHMAQSGPPAMPAFSRSSSAAGPPAAPFPPPSPMMSDSAGQPWGKGGAGGQPEVSSGDRERMMSSMPWPHDLPVAAREQMYNAMMAQWMIKGKGKGPDHKRRSRSSSSHSSSSSAPSKQSHGPRRSPAAPQYPTSDGGWPQESSSWQPSGPWGSTGVDSFMPLGAEVDMDDL